MNTPSTIKRIIVSRTDAIGDVMLTLPVCGLLKQKYPNAAIIFLGRNYTKAVINCCEYVDEFYSADDLLKLNEDLAVEALQHINADVFIHVFPNKHLAQLARKAKIGIRIGTTNRIFHWGNVNKLVKLSRKNSSLHESQLNCKLLSPLGINTVPSLNEISNFIGFTKIPSQQTSAKIELNTSKKNIILHPKSNASAREWSLEHYKTLIELLPKDQFSFYISGTQKEKLLLADWIKTLPSNVSDITGVFSLEEFIAFINTCDCLVAASTGPLHIAAALGINAIGIYPPIKPMHPGRWQAIGKKADYFCAEKNCNDCRKTPVSCKCINEVTAHEVAKRLSLILSQKT